MAKKLDAEPARPFRLRDATTQKPVPGRAYVHEVHAHNGALVAVRWSKLGTTYEVLDVRNMGLRGVYAHKVNGIHITKFVKPREVA